MKTHTKLLLIMSLSFNTFFLLKIALDRFNSPTYRLGGLKKDISIRLFHQNDTVLFELPKGLTVRDVSPMGIGAIGQFENNRFEIIVTSDQVLVDYDKPKDELMPFGNYYSVKNDDEID